MVPRQLQARLLWHYCLLTYFAVLLNLTPLWREIDYVGWLTPVFVAAVSLTYGVLYLLPVLGLLLILDRLLMFPSIPSLLARTRIRSAWVIRTAAVLGFSVVQVVLFGDRFIYHLYGFHVDGFVWNLLTTRGGIESLGGEGGTTRTFVLIVLGILASQTLLLVVVLGWSRLRGLLDRFSTRRAIVVTAVLTLVLGVFQQVTYGVCRLEGYTPVLLASNAFPFYQPISFNTFARHFGIEPRREHGLNVHLGDDGLEYPLHPIQWQAPAKPYNLVLLVAESLRADMLDPDIMPKTWELAQKSNWFRQHYSGGNGTRMAMFSLFYGLYGSYWFSFLDNHRGPVLIDTLIAQNYQMKMFTSARFTYPEFDKTIFARIPADQLHEGELQPKWRRDRENTELLLDFVEQRDRSRPFMTFLFFESAHASYYFPKETIIRAPYAEDLNYATMDVEKDIQLIKNRYINACNHLDTQFDRIFSYLREQNLLESTIVVVTGDHGEEFMEKGHWGHNSTFSEEQTRTPFVLWIPRMPPREITHMTSHTDLAATLMPLLGVTNPPADYSLGHDLLGTKVADCVVICDWNKIVYVTADYKAVYPVNAYGFTQQLITTKDDGPVADEDAFFERNQPHLLETMKNMKLFSHMAATPTEEH